MKTFIFIFVFASFLVSQSLYNNVGHIPTNSQVDWFNAGLLSNNPLVADNVFNVTDYGGTPNDGQNDYNAVLNAINAARNASGLSIIYFPSGTFNINSTIYLNANDHDIVFQGNGSTSTTLSFTVGKNNVCFSISGSVVGDKVILNSGMSKGSNTISVSNSSNFSVGDWIHYFEYLFPIEQASSWPKSVGQITRIESINSNTFTLLEETSKSYSSQYGPYVEKIDPVENIGIEKLKIKRLDTGKANSSSDGNNISFSNAVNCWIKGVEFDNTCEHHVVASFSSHLKISGCYFNDARDHGDGGYGYGVNLQRSTNFCLIENNIFKHLRHSMLVQAGANSNVFSANYSREAYATYDLEWYLELILTGHVWAYLILTYGPPDICLHGRYPFANLFEQNNVELIAADDSHDDATYNNGPYNAFVRNCVYDDPADQWRIISLTDAPHSSVLGNYIYSPDQCPLRTSGSTTLDRDLHGRAIYEDPPNNTYETGIEVSHCLVWLSSIYNWNNTFLNDISYYYSSEPSFFNVSYTDYTWPACGPSLSTDLLALTQSVPARGRWSHNVPKSYINDATQWPPQPLAVTISGPTSLGYNEQGTFTANPSGGKTPYTNYRWWERKDEGGLVPESVDGVSTILAPPPGEWIYVSSWEGQQTVQVARTYDFSLKCEVTDSDNNTTTDIHSVVIGGGFAKAQSEADEISMVAIPENVELTGNYSNPFNPNTTIRFGLPDADKVLLQVFNVNGQLIATLVDG